MKNKIKEKRVVILLTILIGLSLIFIISGVAITYNDSIKEEIKERYNKYVVINKDTNIYDKDGKSVGTINKNFQVQLDKMENSLGKYFKIKDSSFYVYYKDIKKVNKVDLRIKNSNYLALEKKIKLPKKTTFYQDNKQVISIDKEVTLDVEYIDNNVYYVYFLNNLLEVKKTNKIKDIAAKNIEVLPKNLSIINYETIAEQCTTYDCTTISNLREQIAKLKENGYYTITIDEYKNYLVGNLRLKDKAILLTTGKEFNNIKSLSQELGINLEIQNSELKAATKYQIKSYSTIENIMKMAAGEEVSEQPPVVKSNQGIAVLNYHFFYDPNLGESCNEGICLTVQKFREHLEYLKNNGYRTLTMNEFKQWMYNELQLSEKSVLITIDDGAMGTGKHNGNKLIPLLEEYKMHATLFLITGWWNIENYRSPYLDIQSHTNDMHQYGSCGRGQLNCESYDKVKADLQQSINIVGNTDSFCFPFYYSSDTSIQAVKEAGFKMAFVGGNRKATRANNKFLIPRYPIHSNITLARFIDIVS